MDILYELLIVFYQLLEKPIYPFTELLFIIDAIKQVAVHHPEWGKDYIYNKHTNEFIYKDEGDQKDELVRSWFTLENYDNL